MQNVIWPAMAAAIPQAGARVEGGTEAGGKGEGFARLFGKVEGKSPEPGSDTPEQTAPEAEAKVEIAVEVDAAVGLPEPTAEADPAKTAITAFDAMDEAEIAKPSIAADEQTPPPARAGLGDTPEKSDPVVRVRSVAGSERFFQGSAVLTDANRLPNMPDLPIVQRQNAATTPELQAAQTNGSEAEARAPDVALHPRDARTEPGADPVKPVRAAEKAPAGAPAALPGTLAGTAATRKSAPEMVARPISAEADISEDARPQNLPLGHTGRQQNGAVRAAPANLPQIDALENVRSGNPVRVETPETTVEPARSAEHDSQSANTPALPAPAAVAARNAHETVFAGKAIPPQPSAGREQMPTQTASTSTERRPAAPAEAPLIPITPTVQPQGPQIPVQYLSLAKVAEGFRQLRGSVEGAPPRVYRDDTAPQITIATQVQQPTAPVLPTPPLNFAVLSPTSFTSLADRAKGEGQPVFAEASVDITAGEQKTTLSAATGQPRAAFFAGADTARSVASQVLAQASKAGKDSVELSLSPRELGKVRMTMNPSEAGIVVSLIVDRPETLDLMRRHSDLLAQEFRAAGYEHVDIGFASMDMSGSGGAFDNETGADQGARPDTQTGDPSGTKMNRQAQAASRGLIDGLDIRL